MKFNSGRHLITHIYLDTLLLILVRDQQFALFDKVSKEMSIYTKWSEPGDEFRHPQRKRLKKQQTSGDEKCVICESYGFHLHVLYFEKSSNIKNSI